MGSGPLSEGGGRGSAVGLHFSDDSTLQVRAPYAYSKRTDPDDEGDPVNVSDDGIPIVCESVTVTPWSVGPGNVSTGTVTFPPLGADASGTIAGTVLTCIIDTDGDQQTIGNAWIVDTFEGSGYFTGLVEFEALSVGQRQYVIFQAEWEDPSAGTGAELDLYRFTEAGTPGPGTWLRASGFGGNSAWVDLGLDPGVAYTVRFKLDLPTATTTTRVKAWVEGAGQPDWQATSSREEADPTIRLEAFVSAQNHGGLTTVISDVTWCYEADLPVAFGGEMYGPVLVATADGTTSLFTLPAYPGGGYVPGTLDARIDGVAQPATETDPEAGTFDFGVDPMAGDIIRAVWRVSS